jgi:hypothetical protein
MALEARQRRVNSPGSRRTLPVIVTFVRSKRVADVRPLFVHSAHASGRQNS